MTEIVERLERQAVNVENDGHVSAARAMREAATALTEARAEIEWLRGDLVNERRVVTTQSKARVAAESELSTLRARVREVVWPFARADRAIGSEPGPFRFETGTGHRLIERGDLAAASRFMEELK